METEEDNGTFSIDCNKPGIEVHSRGCVAKSGERTAGRDRNSSYSEAALSNWVNFSRRTLADSSMTSLIDVPTFAQRRVSTGTNIFRETAPRLVYFS